MSIPSVAPSTARSAASSAQSAPVQPQNSAAASTQATEDQPAATVTLSKSAQGTSASKDHPERGGAKKAGTTTPTVTTTTQTSTSSYAARVQALMSNNSNLTISEAMLAAGVPQTDQQQVTGVLGGARQSSVQ